MKKTYDKALIDIMIIAQHGPPKLAVKAQMVIYDIARAIDGMPKV